MSSPPPPPGATTSSSTPAPANANTTNTTTTTSTQEQQPQKDESNLPLADAAVLEYLKGKGLVSAVAELTKLLEQGESGVSSNNTATDKPLASGSAHSESSTLSSSTRKLMDRLEDASDESKRRTLLTKSTGGSYGYDRDTACPVATWGIPDAPNTAASDNQMGVQEAKMYLDSFCALQLWVLSLPDQDGIQQRVVNPMLKAQALVRSAKANSKQAMSTHEILSVFQKEEEDVSMTHGKTWFDMPPSAKPELLAVTFALLVHTYCELLEVGMESSAHTIRDAYKPVYESLYPTEYRDLHKITTTDAMMSLNSHSAAHMDAASTLKSILVQIASYQLHREECHLNSTAAPMGSYQEAQQQAALKQQRIQEYDRNIALLQKRYADHSQRATAHLDRVQATPFLRRARAARWQLTMSTTTYSLLAQFLNHESLLAMSTLLQQKCELHVERRDPLPFCPASVLTDQGTMASGTTDDSSTSALGLNQKEHVLWAAPAPNKNAQQDHSKWLPKYEWDEESDESANKQSLEFNRNLLVCGFRRLEALERKRTMQVLPAATRKRLKDNDALEVRVNPLEPSILLLTLCASATTGGPVLLRNNNHRNNNSMDAAAIWQEAGFGLCCAQVCPPDGRRVAVGCDDAAVRIFQLSDSNEPETVLLGHKNGFPVFDVSWNRDGRSLLTAGGDGSIRLWDTAAVGPFGQVPAKSAAATVSGTNSNTQQPLTESTTTTTTTSEPNTTQGDDSGLDVPGLKAETAPYTSGAALAVYRGHAPSCPVWSVAFSPAGYYFCSTGGDGTARLWTTDRPVPVRLFCGHTAANVNCVTWHPNCNYILTGSDDKTARLWDVHTGRTVRLLNGCPAGIHAVAIAPSGRYAAGADHFGIVHLWDLGNGNKVCEFRPNKMDPNNSMVHSLAFSACGTALAAGGDDCCVRIWDVREEALEKPVVTKPTKTFATRRTMLLDLHFNRRNLLLSVGKVVTPVPLVSDTGE